jgi:hypothetical protein
MPQARKDRMLFAGKSEAWWDGRAFAAAPFALLFFGMEQAAK